MGKITRSYGAVSDLELILMPAGPILVIGQKKSKRSYQLRARVWRDLPVLRSGKHRTRQRLRKVAFTHGNVDARSVRQPFRSRDLMVVTGFQQITPARHDYKRPSNFQRRQHRTHAGMGNHHARTVHFVRKLCRRNRFCKRHRSGFVFCTTNLRKYLNDTKLFRRPCIHRGDKTIERHLRTYGDEDQITPPLKRGPPSSARCSHCVSQRSQKPLTRRPDIDICSTFAMLSSQTVLAPIHLPIRNATTPGAAPVDMTTSGRSRTTIQPT